MTPPVIGLSIPNDRTPEIPVDVIARAIGMAKPIVEPPARAKPTTKPSDLPPARATFDPPSIHRAPARDAVLLTIRNLGRTLDDLERLRIMNGNRIRAAQADGIDLPWMESIDSGLKAVEHEAELQLKRAWRKHPLAPWAKAIPGAGEVLMARLIAEIGDPSERPNPGKLLAYCGHGDPARGGNIPKGATQEELFKRGNPHAKKAVWKLAHQFMRTVGSEPDATVPTHPSLLTRRARSPYRDLYEQRKTATEGKQHEAACVRCGPSGHPALPGSAWSDAHRHADALRVVGKQFLIDLWIASRQLHSDAHTTIAGAES